MDISINIHAVSDTVISRNLPTNATPGGWISIGNGGYPGITIFADREDPATFWRYLAAVATDMATYTDIHAGK